LFPGGVQAGDTEDKGQPCRVNTVDAARPISLCGGCSGYSPRHRPIGAEDARPAAKRRAPQSRSAHQDNPC